MLWGWLLYVLFQITYLDVLGMVVVCSFLTYIPRRCGNGSNQDCLGSWLFLTRHYFVWIVCDTPKYREKCCNMLFTYTPRFYWSCCGMLLSEASRLCSNSWSLCFFFSLLSCYSYHKCCIINGIQPTKLIRQLIWERLIVG